MNLKELSAALGLSPTTVSRALNGYPEVSAATRTRVIEAAQRYGYVPHATAKRLATGRAMAIGHVIPLADHQMINPIFADFIAGAGETYSDAGYNMVLSVVPSEEEEAAYRNLSAAQSIDGFVVHAPRAQDPRIRLLTELGQPFVVHGRTETDERYAWLDIDNAGAFHKATEYLLTLGHTRIALLNGLDWMQFARRREAGYRAALDEAGVARDPALVASAEMTEPNGFAHAQAMLAKPDPPTAFLASSLLMALGVSRAIAAQGLELGREVSVITHDDAMGFLPNPGRTPLFTATRSSVRAAGKRLAEMLIDKIEGRAPADETVLWTADLVIGQSTGPAPGCAPKAVRRDG